MPKQTSKTPDFATLQAKWKVKLKDSGFKDIEQDADNLKRWDSHYFRTHYAIPAFEAKQEYYRMAGQFLHDKQFSCILDRFIWQQHSDGVSIANIVKAAKQLKYKTHRVEVGKILNKLKAEMFKLYREIPL